MGDLLLGPTVITASLSVPQPRGRSGDLWQYHSRSDLHSKVVCWVAMADLLAASALLRVHTKAGKVVFGVNHELRDFQTGRKKVLDFVIARPNQGLDTSSRTLLDLADRYKVKLSSAQRVLVSSLPELREGSVGAVLVALEAKAAMTEHSKARPRLYDELTSSHTTIHGASSNAIAIGTVLVNASEGFISTDLNRRKTKRPNWSRHEQPRAVRLVVEKMTELQRRTHEQQSGFDGLAVIVVDCPNDDSAVRLVQSSPAPQPGDLFEYAGMISRVAHEYDARFRNV